MVPAVDWQAAVRDAAEPCKDKRTLQPPVIEAFSRRISIGRPTLLPVAVEAVCVGLRLYGGYSVNGSGIQPRRSNAGLINEPQCRSSGHIPYGIGVRVAMVAVAAEWRWRSLRRRRCPRCKCSCKVAAEHVNWVFRMCTIGIRGLGRGKREGPTALGQWIGNAEEFGD